MTTAYERLLLEAIPDGTFGGAHPPADPPPREDLLTTTTEEAAHHAAVLAAAIDGWHWDEDPRHLRAVPSQPQTEPTRSAA